MELPHPWGIYADSQEQLAHRNHVDDQAWGLEEALNRFLDAPLTEQQLARAVRSQRRKERYRRALLQRSFDQDARTDTPPDGAIDARRRLRLIKRKISPKDLVLLMAVGEGVGYHQIACETKVTAGALRVRVHRLRRALGG